MGGDVSGTDVVLRGAGAALGAEHLDLVWTPLLVGEALAVVVPQVGDRMSMPALPDGQGGGMYRITRVRRAGRSVVIDLELMEEVGDGR